MIDTAESNAGTPLNVQKRPHITTWRSRIRPSNNLTTWFPLLPSSVRRLAKPYTTWNIRSTRRGADTSGGTESRRCLTWLKAARDGVPPSRFGQENRRGLVKKTSGFKVSKLYSISNVASVRVPLPPPPIPHRRLKQQDCTQWHNLQSRSRLEIVMNGILYFSRRCVKLIGYRQSSLLI